MACSVQDRPKKGETGEEQSDMLNIFFDINGIVHKKLILAGQSVSSAYYYDILQ
jgi:hypothetical protein